MRKLGIDRLCVFGMPPVEFVQLAYELGCSSVGIGLAPTKGYNPDGHRDWSLRDDPAMRRQLVAATRDTGVSIGMVEGFAAAAGRDICDFAHDLDLVRELGGDRIACVSLDKDLRRTIDQFASLAEMAAERGLLVSAEMGSLGPYGLVEPALTVVRGVAMSNFSLMIDAMHFFRLGNTVDQLAAFDPALIGYAQLCDARWAPGFATYIEEAMYERMVPGEGELPLRDFIRLIPSNVIMSLEIPMRSLADSGIGPRERLVRCVVAAKTLLADIA